MNQVHQYKSREGLALVIVLGFVAVLAVMAVSLMVTMRIERLATTSFAEVTRARQLVNAALARALDDIDSDMLTGGNLYPRTNMFYLTAGNGVISNGLFTAVDRAYVPASVTSALPKSIRLDDVRVGTNVIGRVGYVAVDCSGLVDVNLADMSLRSRGLNGGELQLSPSILTEINNLGDFLYLRTNTWRRLESLAELYYAGVAGDVISSNNPPRGLFPYSRFGLDYNPTGFPKISIGGDTNALMARRDEIVDALKACNMPNAETVFTNLLDYVDTDNIPRDLNSFCTEAVPMINEIIFSNSIHSQVSGIDTIYTHDVYMTIETWFPFPDRSYDHEQIDVPHDALTFALPSPAFTQLQPLIPDPAEDSIPPGVTQKSITNHPPNSFALTTFQWRKIGTNVALVQGAMMGMKASFADYIYVKKPTGEKVDQVKPNGMASLIAGGGNPQRYSFYIKDPRLNHESTWILDNGASPGTPGRTNANLATEGEGPSTMYVRDYPLDLPKINVGLGTVGELGFLSVGKPWRTIALYNATGTNLNPVLDYFTLETNPIRRALVNINSPNQPALASVFYANPIDSYPGGVGPTVTVNAANTLADNLIDRLSANNRYETNRSLSVLGEFDSGLLNSINGQLVSPALNDDATREALVRNAAGLFSYRQNLFTVFLYAQSITPGGVTGAEQRAVAVVWRDPEYGDPANQPNKTLMRFFKWL